MDSSSVSVDGTTSVFNDNESMVDPFLVEALQNPRHRLTILRMELDIQRFLSDADQQHFEFQHFPSSYLRLAAHRVAQHYGLQTMVQDGLDGQGSRIMVRKLAESRYPAVRLSEIPAKQLETDKPEQIKIVIRPRPCRTNASEAYEAGRTGNLLRSVEERMEEYDRARARIFSSPRSSDLDEKPSQIPTDGRNSCMNKDENETCRNSVVDSEKCNGREISSTRVAIFRDREKDRTDPDYDRSYRRYARNTPNSIPNLVPYNLPKAQRLFAPYDPTFNQMGHMSQTQAPLGFVPPTNQVMSPFATGVNQSSGNNAAYMQWPNASMMYAHTYDQFRHTVYQAPFSQQPLSFDYSQNY